MTRDNDKRRGHNSEQQTDETSKPTLAGWKKLLLAVSGVLMVAGIVAGAMSAGGGDQQATTQGAGQRQAPSSVRGLTGDTDPAAGESTAQQDGSLLDGWGGAVFRLGFGFFAGFAIAFALRAFLKIGLIIAGVVILALIGLQAAGVAQIDWSAISARFDTLAAWLGEQFDSLKEFITGYIPSAGSAIAGLAAGFTRR